MDTDSTCVADCGKIGAQEYELPPVLLGSLLDHLLDLGLAELAAGILPAVGHHNEDDTRGTIFLLDFTETLLKVVYAPPHGIEQRGRGPRHISGASQFGHLADGLEMVDDLVWFLRVELGQRKGRPAGLVLLLLEKCVEPADGVVPDLLHGSRVIKDYGNMRVVLLHCWLPFLVYGHQFQTGLTSLHD